MCAKGVPYAQGGLSLEAGLGLLLWALALPVVVEWLPSIKRAASRNVQSARPTALGS